MIAYLGAELWFPPASRANKEGILAVGGDLSVERLLLAYRSGIFPWFNDDEPPIWWCPNPRMVLFPEELTISHSMRALLRKRAFDFRMNTDFDGVLEGCRSVPRPGQDGTWITDDIIHSYRQLYDLGHVLTAESWLNGQLVGGLYGVRIGRMFFGESMFSKVSNASKYAFITLVSHLQQEGFEMIDCQVYTPHLERLGARLIPRAEFLHRLNELVRKDRH